MVVTQAEAAIQEINAPEIKGYRDYWASIAPKDNKEYFMRWVFSFLSVHTGWKSNVDTFQLLNKDFNWFMDDKILNELLILGRVGLHARRTKGIGKFSKEFWENPDEWKKKPDETWLACRDRLSEKCFGLGLAKTAFALEMCYPNEAESVCLDTHMLQLYGFTTEKEKAKGAQYSRYTEMEAHWIEQCKIKNVPSYIARSLFWDKKQKKGDSRYWSYVFENGKEETNNAG